MKTWIVILALFLSACGTDAHAQPKKSPSKWRFEVKKGVSVESILVGGDGDLIAAGSIKGASDFGGQKLESDESGVWVARLASNGTLKWVKLVDPPKKKFVGQTLNSITVADDGSIRVDLRQREAPHLRRVSITADGATQTVDDLIPDTRTMASSVLANADSIASSEAGVKDKCKGAIAQRVQPGGKRLWSVCNDKVDLSALNLIDVAADGRSVMCAHEWVAGFSTAGKRSWQAKHPKELWCEKLALSSSGEAVVVYDGPPTQSVTQWKANGKLGWTTPCTTILKGSGNCLLDALAVRGAEVFLSVRNADTSMIAVLDAKTGAVKKSYPLGTDAAFHGLVTTDSTIVFGTGGHGMTIEGFDR